MSTNGSVRSRVAAQFAAAYGRPPAGVWAAPGRVNLIGEHTDYNEGFVLPIALPAAAVLAAAPRSDGQLRARSRQRPGEAISIGLSELRPGAVTGWGAYPAGVLWALGTAGHRVTGIDLLVDSQVPEGSGLSSSAALECVTALAVAELSGLDSLADDRWQLAVLARQAETDFAGVPCGLMDQVASLLCTAGAALFFDTARLAVEQIPLDLGGHELALLVIDTRAPHRLVDSAYAERRASCNAAAAALGLPSLRTATAAEVATLTDPVLRRRARHVVTENERVLASAALLRANRPDELGPLLSASHRSLADDYAVSSPELDAAVEAALATGALGARMTGAGFGGSAIALVPADRSAAVTAAVSAAFAAHDWPAPQVYPVQPARGAHRLPDH